MEITNAILQPGPELARTLAIDVMGTTHERDDAWYIPHIGEVPHQAPPSASGCAARVAKQILEAYGMDAKGNIR